MAEQAVEIVEVSARDGLQNDPRLVPTGVKAELVRRARAAGLRRQEVTSFVNPAKVPQMADAEDLMRAVRAEPAPPAAIGLVLNGRGLQRALEARCDEINFVMAASETFNERNQGASTARSLGDWAEIAAASRARGVRRSFTLGVSFGCPFEGEVPPARVLGIVEAALAAAPDEIAFADTIGCGVPSQIRALAAEVRRMAPGVPIRFHFHNTRGTASANVLAAVEAGARAIDASIGGVGGCPFAPAATGNVATEDVVYMLDRMGVPLGIDLDALVATARWLQQFISRPIESGLARAGVFPGAVGREGSRR